MTWIYALPAWVMLAMSVLISLAITIVLLRWFRRSAFHRAEISHNDVAGPVVATAGTVLAVMLSFMVVTVWQQFDQSAANVQTEAASLSDLYTVTNGLPNSVRGSLQKQITGYLRTVITKEWPLMRVGLVSPAARHDLYALYRSIADYTPHTPEQREVRAGALRTLQTAIDARRRRIYDNQEGIPGVLWAVMLATSVITLSFLFFFRMHDERTHIIFTGGLVIIIVIVCVLIAELDYPFRGDISIAPTSLQNTMDYIHTITTK